MVNIIKITMQKTGTLYLLIQPNNDRQLGGVLINTAKKSVTRYNKNGVISGSTGDAVALDNIIITD